LSFANGSRPQATREDLTLTGAGDRVTDKLRKFQRIISENLTSDSGVKSLPVGGALNLQGTPQRWICRLVSRQTFAMETADFSTNPISPWDFPIWINRQNFWTRWMTTKNTQ
jgi:hypothetical protein